MVDTINGFIRDYDETEYLVLFGLEKYDVIFKRISYLIGLKNSIFHSIIMFRFGQIKV